MLVVRRSRQPVFFKMKFFAALCIVTLIATGAHATCDSVAIRDFSACGELVTSRQGTTCTDMQGHMSCMPQCMCDDPIYFPQIAELSKRAKALPYEAGETPCVTTCGAGANIAPSMALLVAAFTTMYYKAL